jgi:hypothetical protein
MTRVLTELESSPERQALFLSVAKTLLDTMGWEQMSQQIHTEPRFAEPDDTSEPTDG